MMAIIIKGNEMMKGPALNLYMKAVCSELTNVNLNVVKDKGLSLGLQSPSLDQASL